MVVVGKKRKAMDDPEEMKVSSEGYDDESKLLRTVFVGNLHLKMKKKGLFKVFSKFGEIESVRIRSVPTLDGKKLKKVQIISGKINEAADIVHAYIVFKAEQSAEASLAHNMSAVEGNHIRVDRACPPRKKLKEDCASAPLYNNKRTVLWVIYHLMSRMKNFTCCFVVSSSWKIVLKLFELLETEAQVLGRGLLMFCLKQGKLQTLLARNVT